jgi:hypothetical protein
VRRLPRGRSPAIVRRHLGSRRHDRDLSFGSIGVHAAHPELRGTGRGAAARELRLRQRDLRWTAVSAPSSRGPRIVRRTPDRELGQEDVLRAEPKWRDRGAVSATSTTWAIRA